MSGTDLVHALNRELSSSIFEFTLSGSSTSSVVATLTRVDRFVGVFESNGSYLLSYSWRGRQQGHGEALDISSAADSARRWVEGSGLESLAAAHPFVKFSGLQLAREKGNAVEFQWATLLDLVEGDWKSFRDLVVLASGEAFLKQFFPHLGHRFALSVDEYSEGILVAVFAYRPGWFVVYDSEGEGFEFEGDAPHMVGHLVNRLNDQIP